MLSVWGKIMIPMYRLWLHHLYGLYGPRCLLSPEMPLNLITHFVSWTSWRKLQWYMVMIDSYGSKCNKVMGRVVVISGEIHQLISNTLSMSPTNFYEYFLFHNWLSWSYVKCNTWFSFGSDISHVTIPYLIARFMGPTWGPSVADRTQVGPMLDYKLCYLGYTGAYFTKDFSNISQIWKESFYSHSDSFITKFCIVALPCHICEIAPTTKITKNGMTTKQISNQWWKICKWNGSEPETLNVTYILMILCSTGGISSRFA